MAPKLKRFGKPQFVEYVEAAKVGRQQSQAVIERLSDLTILMNEAAAMSESQDLKVPFGDEKAQNIRNAIKHLRLTEPRNLFVSVQEKEGLIRFSRVERSGKDIDMSQPPKPRATK